MSTRRRDCPAPANCRFKGVRGPPRLILPSRGGVLPLVPHFCLPFRKENRFSPDPPPTICHFEEANSPLAQRIPTPISKRRKGRGEPLVVPHLSPLRRDEEEGSSPPFRTCCLLFQRDKGRLPLLIYFDATRRECPSCCIHTDFTHHRPLHGSKTREFAA